jgi:hypothetical protein
MTTSTSRSSSPPFTDQETCNPAHKQALTALAHKFTDAKARLTNHTLATPMTTPQQFKVH